MRKLSVFNNISVDGYFTDRNGDLSWANDGSDDAEFQKFVAENASGDGALVFGRKTYERMARFWPTPDAIKAMPVVAEGMNRRPKFVFSKTLNQVGWNNTTLLKGDLLDEIRKLKSTPGSAMVILGSGSIVSQLAKENLIDEFQMLVNPVVLGQGRTLFDQCEKSVRLKLIQSRTFANGKVFLRYALNG
jgi:dihydrofolate reductase